MTDPFIKWAEKTLKALWRDAPDELGCDCTGGLQNAEGWSALEQRLAIGLIQARAMECRDLASSLLINQPGSLKQIIFDLNDRSSKLEAVGLKMAKQWPPVEEEEPQQESRLVQ